MTIDLDYYKNPHSSDNPLGDYCAAYRFYELSDEASALTTFFEGIHSVASVWGSIIGSAVSDKEYVNNLLAQAKDSFRLSKMCGMGGVPEDWYLVNAKPSNWYDLVADKKNLTSIEIAPSGSGTPFDWNMEGERQVALDAESFLNKIHIDVLNVEFVRPWLCRELLKAEWGIRGIKRGYFSTGNTNDNDGILPLITQSMLVGTNLSIEGNFSEKDRNILADSHTKKLSVGPFALKTDSVPVQIEPVRDQLHISAKTVQIVGYISHDVPLCPQTDTF